MSSASLEDWLLRLEKLHPVEIDLGLERVASVAGSLDLLQPTYQVITVAGTNGKGSTVAVLEALLNGAGKSVATFTSPHFLRFNERIRVDGQEVEDLEIVNAFELIDRARGDTSLSYFEFATLAALLIFRQRAPQFAVLEVGLGGRLDSVNIIDPTVAVITRIDLDHQQWLGDDRATIAAEKAGIVRGGRPAVVADPEPPARLLELLAAKGAEPICLLGREFSFLSEGNGLWSGSLTTVTGVPRQLPEFEAAGLLPENICGALQAAALSGVEFSDQQLLAALGSVHLVGRRDEREVAGVGVVLDVAHNPAAVEKMCQYLDARPCEGRTIAVFSVMADKDMSAMIAAAGDSFDAWFLADLPAVARSASTENVREQLQLAGQSMISVSKNPRQAYRRARSVVREGDRLVVFGSFHTVAGVLPALENDLRKAS